MAQDNKGIVRLTVLMDKDAHAAARIAAATAGIPLTAWIRLLIQQATAPKKRSA